MTKILADILENKRAEIARAKAACPPETLREIIEPSTRDFRGALLGGRDEILPKLIAELKRKSPSKKTICKNLDVEKIVKIYNRRAAAISILTDFKFFGGSLEDLCEANHASEIPILRKDFILDEYQLLEARQFGADAVLLIACILEIEEIEKLLAEAKKLGMDCLVEIHSNEDLEKVLKTSAEIIGINSRNLDSLEINLDTIFQLLPKIPTEKIIVAESGIKSREDLDKLSRKVDAVLVGTSILNSDNIEAKLLELTVL
ncbi:MAG: indole-3-glycerol phosphate synthase TrpC [Patescibacteria group bacterium]